MPDRRIWKNNSRIALKITFQLPFRISTSGFDKPVCTEKLMTIANKSLRSLLYGVTMSVMDNTSIVAMPEGKATPPKSL
jgi:hypothetical protein